MVTRDLFVVANLVVQNKMTLAVCCDDGCNNVTDRRQTISFWVICHKHRNNYARYRYISTNNCQNMLFLFSSCLQFQNTKFVSVLVVITVPEHNPVWHILCFWRIDHVGLRNVIGWLVSSAAFYDQRSCRTLETIPKLLKGTTFNDLLTNFKFELGLLSGVA